MIELSRLKLYTSVLEILSREEQDEELKMFIQAINRDFQLLLRVNVDVLEGIETIFLREDNSSDDTLKEFINGQELLIRYTENVQNTLTRLELFDWKYAYKLQKFSDQYFSNANIFFGSLISHLAGIGNKILKNMEYTNSRELRKSKPQIFLSHAYQDKVYTLALFIYFYSKGIFLYVDWIFSPLFNDGTKIKRNLSIELFKSNQLLFLRTIRSELSMSGSLFIRGWCSWELGAFFILKCNCRKFYTEIYTSGKPKNKNKQLDGIRPLKYIKSGRLY